MIAQLLWFGAGFITSTVYADEIQAFLKKLEDKIMDDAGKEVDFEALNRFKKSVKDQPYYEAAKKKRESQAREKYVQNLITETMERVGLDTKEVNMNKTISQISRAVSEAYDKYGEPGTKVFMDKWNTYINSEKKE